MKLLAHLRAAGSRAAAAVGRLLRAVLPEVALGHEKAIAAGVTAFIAQLVAHYLHLTLPLAAQQAIIGVVTLLVVHFTTNTAATSALLTPAGAPAVSSSRTYGWRYDEFDARDVFLDHLALNPAGVPLPAKVDLRSTGHLPPVYDQGQLGSCTANGIGAAIQYEQARQGLQPFVPSRLFIYYNERDLEHTVDQDAGAAIRDGMKTVHRKGAPPEQLWPYEISKFTVRPPQSVYSAAAGHKVTGYARVAQTLHALRSCLAAGRPVVFGFTVYESFESADVARTGDAPMPAQGERVLGGHCVVAVGYDDTTSRFLCRNSWGPSWGQGGYFTLPYAYVLTPGLASDLWTVQVVT